MRRCVHASLLFIAKISSRVYVSFSKIVKTYFRQNLRDEELLKIIYVRYGRHSDNVRSGTVATIHNASKTRKLQVLLVIK